MPRRAGVGHNLKDFIVHARNHATHFSDVEPHAPLERFQKQVLKYDPRAERTTVNHSFRLLEMLRWRSGNDIRRDLLSSFNPTGERLEFGRFKKLRKCRAQPISRERIVGRPPAKALLDWCARRARCLRNRRST